MNGFSHVHPFLEAVRQGTHAIAEELRSDPVPVTA